MDLPALWLETQATTMQMLGKWAPEPLAEEEMEGFKEQEPASRSLLGRLHLQRCPIYNYPRLPDSPQPGKFARLLQCVQAL